MQYKEERFAKRQTFFLFDGLEKIVRCLGSNFLIALETAKPRFQFEHHLKVVGERLADAEAVSPRGIDMH